MSEQIETLRAPFPWFGGKRRVGSLVWERFGDAPNYVEPFAGSLAVLLGRPHPPRLETVTAPQRLKPRGFPKLAEVCDSNVWLSRSFTDGVQPYSN